MTRRQAILSSLLAPFAFKRIVMAAPSVPTINPAWKDAQYEMKFVTNWGNETVFFTDTLTAGQIGTLTAHLSDKYGIPTMSRRNP